MSTNGIMVHCYFIKLPHLFYIDETFHSICLYRFCMDKIHFLKSFSFQHNKLSKICIKINFIVENYSKT